MSERNLFDSNPMQAVASAALVNRTHRVVRERAKSIEARKSTVRSLWIPVLVSSSLVAVLSFAIWSILDQDEVAPTGIPDASQQMFVLLLWCLPVTAAILAVVWFRRSNSTDNGNTR